MRIVFTGGGTAGHINPALALANELKNQDKDTEILFVGTQEGMEKVLVPKAGYAMEFIRVRGFDRSLTLSNIKNLVGLPFSVLQAQRILKKFRPHVVVGTGGYVCGPVLLAASLMKIPTMVHESNALPGVTCRMLSSVVDTVALGVEEAAKLLPKAKHIKITGTPVRPALLRGSSQKAKDALQLSGKPFLVFFGGSLGATDFNKTVVDFMIVHAKNAPYRMLMATGKNHQYPQVMKRFSDAGVDVENTPDLQVVEYIDNMDVVMHGADVVICRAGASTLCELTALGKPAILVPSPYVTDNHQEHNARALEKNGAAVVFLEKEFTKEALKSAVYDLFTRPHALTDMAQASYDMGKRDATEVLCHEIRRLMKK